MITLLLDCGADIEQTLGVGETPLILTCSIGFLDGVLLLVGHGANLNARSTNGGTCLLATLEGGHQSIANYLLDLGVCKVNERGKDGVSALHHAVLLNNGDITRKLIQKQANVNVRNHVRNQQCVHLHSI